MHRRVHFSHLVRVREFDDGCKDGSGTLGILPFMAKWTLAILDGRGWGV